MQSPLRVRRNGPADLFHTFSTGWRNASARVRTTVLHPPAHAASGAASCPSVVLLGLDAAPSPGQRGPTNFMGAATDVLLHDLEDELRSLSLVPG